MLCVGVMLKENPEGLYFSPNFITHSLCDFGPDTLTSLNLFPTCKFGSVKLSFLFLCLLFALNEVKGVKMIENSKMLYKYNGS